MVHSLRKYLSNRGSALFMVLSTMTALMITCMAMYFAVVSSRSAQYAVFNQQQSYQSARSISDIILGGLQSGTLAADSNSLMDKMVSMKEGDIITTDGNGFASLNPDKGSDVDDDFLGAYDVTITRLNDEVVDGDTNFTYDVAITTSVNGVREVVHSIIHIRPAQNAPAPPDDTQVFAATGYVDQDTFLDGGVFFTDMFIDTENTVINAYPGMDNIFTGNFTAGGSVEINGWIKPAGKWLFKRIDNGVEKDNDFLKNEPILRDRISKKAVEWFIRNNLTCSASQVFNFENTSSTRSKIYVGGNLDMGDSWGGIKNADIYVNGDFYYGQQTIENCRIFVHGNVYIRKCGRSLNNIYCDGKVIEINGGSANGSLKGTWEANDNLPSGVLTRHDAMSRLDKATATNTYYKWEINDRYPTIREKNEQGKWVDTKKPDPTYVEEIDELHGKAIYKTLHWSASADNPIPVVTLTYDEELVGEDKYGNTKIVENAKGCIIKDTTCDDANQFNDFTLIIDTGDDPDNVFTIRVQGNRDLDGDPKHIKETFNWAPANYSSSKIFKILVKGRGSVVIDVPEGVTYQDTDRFVMAHYNWWVLAGGTVSSFGGEDLYKHVEMKDSLAKFVHSECGGADDDCSYTETSSDKECKICGGKKNAVTCARHEYTFTYCPTCQKELKDKSFKGQCVNRVDRQAIDKYLADNSTIAKGMDKDKDGNLIYPTTNIFLVSVDESADIRLSCDANKSVVMQNAFFGFIYAPYMTFKGYGGNSSGGWIRFCGGATVSDFIFQDSTSFVTCWPEKLPQELMSESCRSEALAGASKDWKISLGSY